MMNDDFEHIDDDEELPPSKTQIKKESLAFQDMGEKLTQLSSEKLLQMELDSTLLDALQTARQMKPSGARKRQIQFIGKLIRNSDTEQITAALEAQQAQEQNNHQLHRLCEHWRDQLLTEPKEVQNFFDEYPTADRQQLRQLLRNCQKSNDEKGLTLNKRKLFQWLRDFLQTI